MSVETEPFRPLDRAAVDAFYSAWCARCFAERRGDCGILTRAIDHRPGDPNYPGEWVQDRGEGQGNPRCTGFRPYGRAA
jgi:hypothetical protein